VYTRPLLFVEAHWEYQERERTTRPNTMGFFGPTQVPMTRFLANNYCVCDRWFSSLPTSTQPNKLMALAGDSTIDSTKPRLIEDVPLVLEWLEERNVSWRVYHDGLPFFLFFGPDMVLDTPNFRPFEEFSQDLANESAEEFPDVVFVEPMYQSSPHLDDDVPNDNHAPLPVRNGEYFLREVYT
jgi:phospholipase C